jgi:hypothetical protein
MSIHSATMSHSYSSTPRRPGFFRKLVVFLVFVAGITGLMVLINFYQTNLSQFWMTIFVILGVGLAAGAGSRFLFYKWSGFVRFFLMLVVLFAALFVIGIYTNWQIGIGPLNPWFVGEIDPYELIQLGGALLVASIALEAWWKPASRILDDAAPEVRRSSRSRHREQTPVAASMQSMPRSSPLQVRPPEQLTYQAKGRSRLKFAKAARSRGRTIPAAEKLVLARTPQHTRSRRKRLFSRKPQLQISMYEEHKCPFCLEDVKRNDPRGVKKCEVCNTLHHADCWAITGFCQVPHLNT